MAGDNKFCVKQWWENEGIKKYEHKVQAFYIKWLDVLLINWH